jgi:hypothetical protein
MTRYVATALLEASSNGLYLYSQSGLTAPQALSPNNSGSASLIYRYHPLLGSPRAAFPSALEQLQKQRLFTYRYTESAYGEIGRPVQKHLNSPIWMPYL